VENGNEVSLLFSMASPCLARPSEGWLVKEHKAPPMTRDLVTLPCLR
jgi:hypothetical protein